MSQLLCVVGVVQKKEAALAGLCGTSMSLCRVVNLDTAVYLIEMKCEEKENSYGFFTCI